MAHNAVEIYFPEKYSQVVSGLKEIAKQKEVSESKLFLDLIMIGTNKAFPELTGGSYEPKHAK
jgi:hypothetical protein